MNNLPQLSAIIFQIIISTLTLITGLIVTNYDHRLSQEDKQKGHTKLKIIETTTDEIRIYSDKVSSLGEYRDALQHVRKLLLELDKLSEEYDAIKVKRESIKPKIILLIIVNICTLLIEVILIFAFDLPGISIILIYFISTLIIILTRELILRIISPIQKEGKTMEKRYDVAFLELDQIHDIFYKDGMIRNDVTKNLDKDSLKFIKTVYEEFGYAKDLRSKA